LSPFSTKKSAEEPEMRNVPRSNWLKPLLLLALVPFVAQCGDESEIVIEDGDGQDCLLDEFDGGSYAFSVTGVTDGCLGGALEQGIPDGTPFGPVEFPALEELPATVNIPGIPLVGRVSVQVACSGNNLRIAGTEPIAIVVPGFGAVTATVSGILTPVPEDTVNGGITARVTTAPFPTPCNLTLQAIGTLQ
jgi:hypothetical protein